MRKFLLFTYDEYTDISNTRGISHTPMSRWKLRCGDGSLGIKSTTIVTVIKDILARYQFSLDALRGQCNDSTSNMLGKS